MKKLICCALFALVALQAHSQKNDYLSLQLGAGYYYYANIKSSDFYFNYGLSPLLFLNINKLKIGSGVTFATNKYSHNYDVTPFAEFKVRNEGDDNPRYHWRFPNQGLALGIKIGLEFSFKKMKGDNK